MANQLNKGRTFNPGDTVEAADLNNLVDLATALEGIISNQGADTVILATDKLLFWRSPGVLHRGLVSTMPGAGTVTNVAWDTGYPQPTSVFSGSVQNNSTTPQIRLSLDNQTANKVLIGPVSGSAAAPTFRKLVPADLPSANDVIDVAASHIIDCALGNVFWFTMPEGAGTTTLHINNMADGQTIRVAVIQNSGGNRIIAFDGTNVVWPNGTDPVLTAGPTNGGARDLFTFTRVHALTYGTFYQKFLV
jgi:hypothetical protein